MDLKRELPSFDWRSVPRGSEPCQRLNTERGEASGGAGLGWDFKLHRLPVNVRNSRAEVPLIGGHGAILDLATCRRNEYLSMVRQIQSSKLAGRENVRTAILSTLSLEEEDGMDCVEEGDGAGEKIAERSLITGAAWFSALHRSGSQPEGSGCHAGMFAVP
ncbi:hypothetical protein BJ322DRAFT_1016999 [Thelephora terrestris]|uniref:Uncharacterized protein n=1 Tax=Thelephora terrestris TaxID=56493 RepID=A0A9P6L6P9_9AGAM|nr:hypothetical protein BJ322DRAFT_1020660 [Thelephora terrestris]KAF9793516.1 hypothetical protein BJ322DRAFT_1016999 [Thelephora terrestris]